MASGHRWAERGRSGFVLVGAVVVILKLGVLFARDPYHAGPIGGVADAGDFRKNVFGALRPADIARLRSLLWPGDRFYVLGLRQLDDPNNTIGSVRSLLGFSLLPNVMVAQVGEANVVIRVGDAPLASVTAYTRVERLHSGVEVFRRGRR